MTDEDVLSLMLHAADDTGRVFDYRDVAEWPPGALDRLLRVGLLREASGGLMAACPSCDDRHVEAVEHRTGPNGEPRLFICCREELRVEVTPEMCRAWEVDLHALAALTAAAIDLKVTPKPVMPGRLWRLGRIPWKTKTRQVMLATRLAEPDGASVAAHIGAGGRMIVLVPRIVPDDRVWLGRVPAVVALERVASIVGERFAVDGVALMETVAEADAVAESMSLLPIHPAVKKQVIRKQVKAEIKGHLEDDALIAAYAECGSMREAAKLLTDRLGRSVSKDQVARAVRRAGGAAAVIDTDDSPSVSRRVASQSRDRSKKSAKYR